MTNSNANDIDRYFNAWVDVLKTVDTTVESVRIVRDNVQALVRVTRTFYGVAWKMVLEDFWSNSYK